MQQMRKPKPLKIMETCNSRYILHYEACNAVEGSISAKLIVHLGYCIISF